MGNNQINKQADSQGAPSSSNLWDYTLVGQIANQIPDSTKEDIGEALVKLSPLAWGINNFDKTPLGAGIKTLKAAAKIVK